MADKLLKLKLEMVYRDFPMEEAKVKYDELVAAPSVASPTTATTTAVKRKLVKPLLPKSKI